MTEPTIAQKTPMAIEVEEGKTYFWCTCGKSAAQPFCDGSHKGSDFAPMKYQATANEKKFFCCCKQTEGAPFCDGSHSKL